MIAGSWGDIYAASQMKYEGGCCGGSIKCTEANEASAARASVHVPSDLGETQVYFSISIHIFIHIQDVHLAVKEGSVTWKDRIFTSIQFLH